METPEKKAPSTKEEILGDNDEELDQVALKLHEKFKYKQSNEVLNNSLKIKLQKHGGGSIQVARCLLKMAQNCFEQKETLNAITYAQKALENALQHHGEDNLELIEYYDILAKSNLEHLDHITALDFSKKMRKILNKHDQKENPWMLEVHLNFALVYLGFKYYYKMLESCQSAQVIAEKTHGSKSKEMARVLMTYGLYYVAKAERALAGESYTKALGILSEISPDPSRKKSECLRMIAYRYMGDHEHAKDAENYIIEGLEMHKKLFADSEHVDECSFYEVFGQYYMFDHNLNSSLENFEKALKLVEKILGMESSEYIRISEMLAVYYTTIEDMDKALECSNRSLDIKIKLYGENSFNVAESYLEQGELYFEGEVEEEALKCFISASKILEELFGSSHPLISFCQFKIGEITRSSLVQSVEDIKKLGQNGAEYYQVGIDLVQKLMEEDPSSILESDVLPSIIEISMYDDLLAKMLSDEKAEFEKLKDRIHKFPNLVNELKEKITHVIQEAEESDEMVNNYFDIFALR